MLRRCVLLLLLSFAAAARADEPSGLLPLPDYSGDLLSRSHLTGNWGGLRDDLAEKGVQLELAFGQYLQGVTNGGIERSTLYGGKVEYVAKLDLMRMGVLPGALISFRAESRYGQAVNDLSGGILPVNTDGFFPLTDELNEDLGFAITSLNYTQFLGEHVALILGKIDTLDGDLNEFASGRGSTQFMNANFLFSASLALRLPYSTLAAGLIVLPVEGVKLSSMVINTTDSSTTSGFADIGDGGSWLTQAELQHRVGELPGGMNFGFLYSFNQDFAEVGGQLIFQPGQGLVVPNKRSTWAWFGSLWQYLFVLDSSEAPIDTANGVMDRRGLGLFARFGFADEDTNPLDWNASGGIGGRGLIPSRDGDTFGLGYYYARLQPTLLSGFLGTDHAQGFEAYYNVQLTPAAHFTLDLQVVKSLDDDVDTALILGGRLWLSF